MKNQCVVCGKLFHVKPSHATKRVTCSKDCLAKFYKKKFKGEANPNWRGGCIKKICPYCKKEYLVAPGSKDIRKFCSRICKETAQREQTRKLKSIKKKKIKVKVKRIYLCRTCGKEIANGRAGRKTYCSTCSPIGNGKIVSLCSYCHKPFQHYKSRKRRYCSHKCSMSLHNNNKWKGGVTPLVRKIRSCDKNKRQIKQILKRDKYTCQLCGQVGGGLEVDHIRFFSDIFEEFLQQHAVLDPHIFQHELFLIALKYKPFWDKKNLRVLCQKCNWQRQVDRNKGGLNGN